MLNKNNGCTMREKCLNNELQEKKGTTEDDMVGWHH